MDQNVWSALLTILQILQHQINADGKHVKLSDDHLWYEINLIYPYILRKLLFQLTEMSFSSQIKTEKTKVCLCCVLMTVY